MSQVTMMRIIQMVRVSYLGEVRWNLCGRPCFDQPGVVIAVTQTVATNWGFQLTLADSLVAKNRIR